MQVLVALVALPLVALLLALLSKVEATLRPDAEPAPEAAEEWQEAIPGLAVDLPVAEPRH
jgi:hypothetical protein